MAALYILHNLPVLLGALASVLVGAYRLQHLDLATRFLWLNVCLSFFTELSGIIIALKIGNNMPLYSIYSLIELGLVTAYFNYSIGELHRRNLGLVIGSLGIIWGVVLIIYFQPLTAFNSYFLSSEGFIIIGLSFYAFYSLVRSSDDLQLAKLRHFWFPVILCSFWTITLFTWGLHDYINLHLHHLAWSITFSLNMISCAMYLSIGLVFWKFHKLSPNYE